MREVCAEAARRGVSVGAQVSYDDRENFGRVARDVPYELLREQIVDQVGTLREIAAAEGVEVRYVKPHGALYHRVIDDEEQARAVLAGSGHLPVLGMPGALILELAAAAGRTTYVEGFPDRGYGDDGRLLPRDQPGAVLEQTDEIAARAVELAAEVESVCVHGDSPGAVDHARAVRDAPGRRRVLPSRVSCEPFQPLWCQASPVIIRPMTTTPGPPNGVVDHAGRSDARLALSAVAAAVVGFAVLVVLPYAVNDFAAPAGLDVLWSLGGQLALVLAPPAAGLAGSRAVSPCGVAVTSMTRRDDCTWSCSSPWPRSPCSSPPTPGSRPSAGGRTEDPLSTGPVHDHVEIGPLLWTLRGVLWRTLWDRKNVGTSLPEPLARGVAGPVELSYQLTACGGLGIGRKRRS